MTKNGSKESEGSMQQAKKAFSLASIEQLVPMLGEEMFPMIFKKCSPHLSDPTHRETFESAHSVLLGIFATHAQRIGEGKIKRTPITGTSPNSNASFVESLVPFYANCLIEVRTALIVLDYDLLSTIIEFCVWTAEYASTSTRLLSSCA